MIIHTARNNVKGLNYHVPNGIIISSHIHTFTNTQKRKLVDKPLASLRSNLLLATVGYYA